MSLGRLHRYWRPVVLSIGPVMDLRDLVAYKIAALVNRGEVRDFVDVSVFLAPGPVPKLAALSFATGWHPGRAETATRAAVPS